MSADDHRALLRDSIRSFLSRRGGRARARALRGLQPGFDRAYWSELAELGCIGALIAPEHGGVGLALGDMAAMLQELAPALGPEPVIPVAVGAAGLLALAPRSALAARLLPEISAGRLIPALAWQEANEEFPGARSATHLAGDVLEGRKRFVVPANADGYLVVAASADGPEICWVPAGSPGVSARIERRVDGTACADVTFTNVHVGAENRIAGAGVTTEGIAAVAHQCHVCAAAELLGVAESALSMTLDYLRVREQFGKPIGSFQALQHRAVDLYVQQELARAALAVAVEGLHDEAVGALDRSILASRAKARAAEAALRIGREAVQMHGAMGFADECDVGLHLKRALVLSAWLGNATAHRRRVLEALARMPEHELRSETAYSPTTAPLDWDSLSDDEFRLRVREVFEREYPAELRNPPRRLRWHECRDFYARLGELGLLALAWPKEFGGAGLSPRKQLIFMQEQDRHGVARAPDMGLTMVGPGLIRYGTPEQQRRFLPPILAMQEMWCQGFSEPNAGSDLAALRTSAVADGDEYVIEGAKTWTTFAQDATHMFLLARTDKAAKKQAGISVFLVDLKAPGITVRTIRDIAGHEEFCEVHFDRVRVPGDRMLGRANDGWTVAKMLLANERIYLGNPRQAQYALTRLDAIAAARGLGADPVFMARLTELRLDVWDLVALYRRFADQVRRGEALGPDVSILKLFGSETYQRLSELAIECIGSAGALEGSIDVGAGPDDVMSLFLNARPSTIYGGSNEVQRNVLAKQVLGLPS
jgi:alkylation response protein AidB-like acyl-CoA dehydrogenase